MGDGEGEGDRKEKWAGLRVGNGEGEGERKKKWAGGVKAVIEVDLAQ